MTTTGYRESERSRVGVDVGGTFTDLVAVRDGVVTGTKVASRPDDQSIGVMNALGLAGLTADAVEAIAHGTTVATNALLERRGARTALVTTEGFRDLIEIGRQNRPSLYDLAVSPPAPLIPRELRFTVRERIGPRGILIPLDEQTVAEAVEQVRRSEVEAVAICLLFAFADPTHERRVREAFRVALPDVHCSISSDTLPEFREYERFATTTADAYLRPALASYLRRLSGRLERAGFPLPLIMQSSGGVTEPESAADRPSSCVLSGPAAGVVAASFAAGASGFTELLTFDMGGTSTDVSLVLAGQVQMTTGSVIGGVPVKHPMVDVHTVSAGGGSIGWVDSGAALRVGPRSAGAVPGPACYDRGGTAATVTDASLALGYLADGARLGGEITLKRELALTAIETLAVDAGVEPVLAAAGVVAVAEAEMARALRVISVERGVDPRDLTLVAFGGAGGMHACRLAEELGIHRVLVPHSAGVLSALGLAVSDRRRDYVAPLLAELETLSAADFDAAFARLEQRAANDLANPSLDRSADLRYRGQSFELTIPARGLDGVARTFRSVHARVNGYTLDDAPIEVTAVRLTARQPVEQPRLRPLHAALDDQPRPVKREAFYDGAWLATTIVDLDRIGAGGTVEGPAIVSFPGATCVIRPGWRGAVDATGALVVER